MFRWLVGLTVASAALAAPGEQTLIQWEFSQPGDLLGWRPNNVSGYRTVADGALQGTTTGADPFFTSPTFEIPARPWQVVEVVMKSNLAGPGELFWTNTHDSPYEGFAQEKRTPFRIEASDEYRTILIRPFWQGEKTILKLRLDLADAMTYAIAAVRIVEPTGAPETVTQSAWSFDDGPQGWTLDGFENPATADGVIGGTVLDREARLRTPPLQVTLEDKPWLIVRMKTEQGQRAAVEFATEDANGLQTHAFATRPDGRWHTYNIDLGSHSAWRGNLLALAVRPSLVPGDTVAVDFVKLTDDIEGPADLELLYFGQAEALGRTGRPLAVVAKLINHGAEPATGIGATLTGPPGMRIEPAPTRPPRFAFQVPGDLRFQVTSDAPFTGELTLRLTGPGAPPEPVTATVRIEPGPRVPAADYVPPPEPAATDYKIGTYYFPRWFRQVDWEPIDRVAPQRKPVLGWYDESDPEVVDWQIKWAVEHGVRFFLVDWYWNKGSKSLLQWLAAYDRARYRDQLEWAVMWANHNAPGSHSVEDWRAVTQYWIDHYLKQPNYLQVDGKPAVYIWSPANIRRDVGGTEEAAKLYAMSQQMAQDAGLPGITFVAMNVGGTKEQAEQLAAEGYAGNTAYHWWADARDVAANAGRFPFSLVVDRSKAAWEQRRRIVTAAGMFFQPVADTGWDSRPWHGDRSLIIDERTPEQFERLLREAKAYLDEQGERTLVLGPWNEWGEGSYIEPNLEYGFAMLDAIRTVFCEDPEHTDVAPIDVGLGPYELDMTPPEPREKWTFAPEELTSGTGWQPMMNVGDFRIEGGLLQTRTTARDPALVCDVGQLVAGKVEAVRVRAQVLPAAPEVTDRLQLFWATPTQPTAEASSVLVPLVRDGEFHDYLLPVAENPRWRGIVRQLRLDLGSQPDSLFRIDEIELVPAP